MANYMQRLIEKARGGVQDLAKKATPIKEITGAIDGAERSTSPSPPKRSRPVSPKKRKKIKPKNSFFD